MSSGLPPAPPILGSSLLGLASDIIPATDLSALAGGGSKVVDIIGDSTSTEIPVAGYAVDYTQTIWGALKTVLPRKNKTVTSWTFNNRGINSSNWSNPVMTGTATGLTLPGWFTTPANTWLSYVQADAPDLLFICFGTNAPDSGSISTGGGNSISTHIRQFFEALNSWTKHPSVVLITPKVANPLAGGVYLARQDHYRSMAAYMRTFCWTSGKGYSTFPNQKYFGLIDLGRNYQARVDGYDPANQYMRQVPSAITSGGVTATQYTIATTTHGDFRLDMVFRNVGGTAGYTTNGLRQILLAISLYTNTQIAINVGSAGGWVPTYQVDGTFTTANGNQAGTSVPTTTGDVTLTVVMKAEVVRIYINGTLSLDTVAPRFIAKTPITLSYNVPPTIAPSFDIINFYEGVGTPTSKTLTTSQAYGVAGATTSEGGNGLNHPQSETVATDWQIISAANLTA